MNNLSQASYHTVEFWANLLRSCPHCPLSQTVSSYLVSDDCSYVVKNIQSHIVCSLCGGAGYIERISFDVENQVGEKNKEITKSSHENIKRQSLNFIIKKSVLKYLEEEVEIVFQNKDERKLKSEGNSNIEKDDINHNHVITSLLPRTEIGQNKLRSYEVELSFYKILSPLLHEWGLATPIFYHGERQFRQVEVSKASIEEEGKKKIEDDRLKRIEGQQTNHKSVSYEVGYQLVLSDLRQLYPKEIKSLSLLFAILEGFINKIAPHKHYNFCFCRMVSQITCIFLGTKTGFLCPSMQRI